MTIKTPGTCYLVGGSVRDQQLGIPSVEKDWLIVGAIPEQMLAVGFKPVGKSFPVFLHPETSEEYALARTEKKISRGYHGFEFNSSPEVSLEQDLLRRDFTINAIAQDLDGNIYDPYHGLDDINNKKIRHVSRAFVEDPVRLLRAARFLAKFHYLGFSLAAETKALLKQMVINNEVAALVPERVWQELHKSLATHDPEQFFVCLQAVGALTVIFADFVSEQQQLSFRLLSAIKHSTSDLVMRFSAAVLDLAVQRFWQQNTDELITKINKLCRSLNTPHVYQEFLLSVVKGFTTLFKADKISAELLLECLYKTDARRRAERFVKLAEFAQLVAEQYQLEHLENIQAILLQAQQLVNSVDVQALIRQGFLGADLQQALKIEQMQLLNAYLQDN